MLNLVQFRDLFLVLVFFSCLVFSEFRIQMSCLANDALENFFHLKQKLYFFIYTLLIFKKWYLWKDRLPPVFMHNALVSFYFPSVFEKSLGKNIGSKFSNYICGFFFFVFSKTAFPILRFWIKSVV